MFYRSQQLTDRVNVTHLIQMHTHDGGKNGEEDFFKTGVPALSRSHRCWRRAVRMCPGSSAHVCARSPIHVGVGYRSSRSDRRPESQDSGWRLGRAEYA
jgi:hypothetical protein